MNISVIIPTYKSTTALDLCIKSILKTQKFNNEIIVVVDGTAAENETVLEKYKDYITPIILQTNYGMCRAQNIGVYNATHRYVLIVNDDNVFCNDWDVNLFEAINGTKNTIITPNQIEPYKSMFRQFVHMNLGKDPATFDLHNFLSYSNNISENKTDNSGFTYPFLIRKYDYIRLGGFDENYELGVVADWDFFVKLNMSDFTAIRLYSTHFYHFVSISTNDSSPEKNKSRATAEVNGHNYAKYKWGNYIVHDHQTNMKYVEI